MHVRRPFVNWVVVALTGIWLAGCASTQSRHAWLGEPVPARASDAPVEVFRTGSPTRAFRRVARLDVHLEKTGFAKSTFDEALPELRKQARLAGADAVIDIEERRSQLAETMIYHVSATAIRYE